MSQSKEQLLEEGNMATYWTERYIAETDTWDLGKPSTPLVEYINQLSNKDISILIPGCGRGYEAEYLVSKGFSNITLIDISAEPVAFLREKFKGVEAIKILQGDFFALSQTFDRIIEQTFFCALPIHLREAYATKMASLLNPSGKLAGVFFNRTFEQQGPPFGGSIEEYKTLFAPHFSNIQLSVCYNSIPPRAGNEVFMIAEK